MCGIAGFFWTGQQADPGRVQRMCDRIRHRGPDDQGVHTDGGCGIGMRRLSIIDLTTGHQPMSNEDRSVWVVFNGEIYDYSELRRDLIAQGHHFHTHSDTETLIHLYEQEGVEGIAKLRGMFAYALWDGRRRRLMLVRDRFGKKPLYYAVLPQGIVFGSEIKCLEEAGVPLETDEDALKLYFQFNHIPDPYTAYRAIRRLAAGCWLTFDEKGRLEQGRYWRLSPSAAAPVPVPSYEQSCDAVRQMFDEAVRIRLVSDVPLGAFLSGGIDSSLVVASMALQTKEPVKTFSVGFEEQPFNELPYAAAVARHYATDHHEMIVRPDAIGLVGRLVSHFDEPFADSSAIPTLILSEETRRHVAVALSGDGGDEFFGGYESFFAVDRLSRLDAIPQAVRSLLNGAAFLLPYAARGKNYLRMISRKTPLDRYFELSYAHYFLRRGLLQQKWVLDGGAEILQRMLPYAFHPDAKDTLSEVMYWEATEKLTGDMLVKVDRMSMAASLEVRSPLLDHRLAEMAAKLPHSFKIRGGSGKRILIDSMRDRLPPEILNRPKQGFGVPLKDWFRTTLREFLWDHLANPRFYGRNIVQPAFLRYLLEEHNAGRRDNSHWLWSLLMLELWYRKREAH